MVDLPQTDRQRYLTAALKTGDDQLIGEVQAMLDADAGGASPLDRDMAVIAEKLLASQPLPILAAKLPDNYELERVLGEGGMGVVYLARRKDLGIQVAIKLLFTGAVSSKLRAWFAREQRTLARLAHPQIARLYDAGELEDGTPFIVMEYVDGVAITEYCDARSAMLRERLALFRALCQAVQFAHQHAVIHRDIKPSNVLVKSDGSVRLLDFGVAKQLDGLDGPAAQSRTAAPALTPAYAAPEQLRGEPVGLYTDVYALGVVLYELLVGRVPFERTATPFAVAALEERAEPPSRATRAPDLARRETWADLDVLVMTAMHADPQRRYRSVEALIRDIDHLLADEPLEAQRDSVRYRMRKLWVRRRRAITGAGLALAAVIAVTAWFMSRLATERDHADREAEIAASINRFLSDDLLARSSPFQSGQSTEPLIDAVKRAIPDIDRRFSREPAIAAGLHQTVARSLGARGDLPMARRELARAAALYETQGGALAQDAIHARLLLASLEAKTIEPGALDRARQLLSAQEALVAQLAHPRADLVRALEETRGLVALYGNDARTAVQHFEAAVAALERSNALVTEAGFGTRQRLAAAYVRLGDGVRAERIVRGLIADFAHEAQETPLVLLARQTLVHALHVQRKFTDIVAETDTLLPALSASLGEDHAQTLQLLASRAAAEAYMGRLDAAVRDDLELSRRAAGQGPGSLWAVVGNLDAGQIQCRAGQVAQGLAHARAGYDAGKPLRESNGGLAGGMSYNLAICLIASGAFDEAAALLAGIDVAQLAQMGDAMDASAAVALAQAEIAIKRGDRVAATKLLKAATPAFSGPDAVAYQRDKLAELTAMLADRSP